MNSVLQQLYNGELCPAEQYQPLQTEYQNRRLEHRRHYTVFINVLLKLEPPLDKRFI